MSKSGIHHNKKRNCALLYEFLIYHASRCLLDNKLKESKAAVEILKNAYKKGTALHDELFLFKTLTETKIKSKDSAEKILKEVYRMNNKLNARNLNYEKSNLIKEIHHVFENDGIYNYKVPDYTIYASIQTLLSEGRNKYQTLDNIKRVKLEDTVLNYLCEHSRNTQANLLKTNPSYDNVVYKLVVEKFHKKYSKTLTENQRRFLMQYVVYLISENKETMQAVIKEQIEKIKQSLKVIKDPVLKEDKQVSGQLVESYKKINELDMLDVSEDNIMTILQYIKLTDEVES